MAKRWRIRPHDAAAVAAMAQTARVPAIVASLLLARGVQDPEQVQLFLESKLSQLREPTLLPGVNLACERILAAIKAEQKIVIYGDYDVDGMTATSLLLGCLKLLGAQASYYIPSRIEEGYGLNGDALRKLAERGTQLVITVDCGIASIEEAQVARQLGLDLIITDHHALGPTLPEAVAIVHPQLPGGGYPFAGLCGAGVAFKLAWALCQGASEAKRVSERMRKFLLQAVGLAALGTIADVVPLVDENRVLVRHGLEALKKLPVLGLAALYQVTGLNQKETFGSDDVAFTIAPRLNAAGRLGQATLAVELLTTESSERASALAEYLHELNGSRDSLERSIYLAAHKQAQQYDLESTPALVLAGTGWHPGIIGIVATRLVEKFHRPVVMIALDELGVKPGVGSARSVPGFNLHAALTECTELLEGYGGHAAAAGLRIAPHQVEAFRAAFCEHAQEAITPAQRVAELAIDAEVIFGQLTYEAVQQIDQMAPFGSGNPRPLFCATDVQLVEPPRKIGNDRHLSLKLRQDGVVIRGVAFGGGDWAEALSATEQKLAIAFHPVINEYRGRRSVEMHVVDWQPAAQRTVVASDQAASVAAR